jgi:hypothetical protein
MAIRPPPVTLRVGRLATVLRQEASDWASFSALALSTSRSNRPSSEEDANHRVNLGYKGCAHTSTHTHGIIPEQGQGGSQLLAARSCFLAHTSCANPKSW